MRTDRLHRPQVEAGVLELIEEARKRRDAVTQETIVAFAMKTRDRLLACGNTPRDIKSRITSFAASSNWIKHFVHRQGLKSVRLHRNAGGVDDTASREATKEVKRERVANTGCAILIFSTSLRPERFFGCWRDVQQTSVGEGRRTCRRRIVSRCMPPLTRLAQQRSRSQPHREARHSPCGSKRCSCCFARDHDAALNTPDTDDKVLPVIYSCCGSHDALFLSRLPQQAPAYRSWGLS